MRFSRIVSLLLAASCAIHAVSAIPLQWTLHNISWATGNFVFDENDDAFSNINIATTADGNWESATYAVLRSSVGTDNMDLRLYPEGTDTTKDLRGIFVFSLQVPTLTNAGGKVGILSASERECADPGCQGLFTSPFNPTRVTTTGYVEASAPPGTEDNLHCWDAMERCETGSDCCSERCNFGRCSFIPRVFNISRPNKRLFYGCYDLRVVEVCFNEPGTFG